MTPSELEDTVTFYLHDILLMFANTDGLNVSCRAV
jgi:hypothetical protein